MSNPEALSGHTLLAEDSPDTQALISMCLRKMGATVMVVGTGKLAVEAALTGEFDLILMDMQMPVLDGIEAVKCLRKAGYAKPIVMLTANEMEEDRDKCIEAGCEGFLTKPIDQQHFYQVIFTYLKPAALAADQAAARAKSLEEDPEFQDLAKRFAEGLSSTLERMSHAAQSRDWAGLKALAHNLKGMGGGFGRPELTDMAARIESECAQEDKSALAASIAELNLLCKRNLHGQNSA